jgi:N-acetylmuramoyl-L-alanine amidase
VNSASIGIEIDNNGVEIFTEPQVASLLILLDTLKTKYGIPTANFIGHADIAPTRKVDPNVFFPWQRLAEKGFGLWYDDTTGIAVPGNFDNLQALRVIGYDVRDSVAAIAAFKRKYVLVDSSKALTDTDRKILYALYKKYP